MSHFCHIYYNTKKKEENPRAISRKLLAYGFLHSFGISYEEGIIVRGMHGKPYYMESKQEGIDNISGKPIFFNLSHGQELIAVACADCEVGIDAESMRTVHENAMRRTCTQEEWEWLQHSGQKEKDFLRLWTLKESYMKMTGEGMAVPPNTIGFSLEEADGVIRCEKDGVFRQYLLPEGIISVCQQGKNWDKSACFRIEKVTDDVLI